MDKKNVFIIVAHLIEKDSLYFFSRLTFPKQSPQLFIILATQNFVAALPVLDNE
jgi:hypothetical protein